MQIRLSFLRNGCRLGVIAAFCALPWLNAAGMHGISGSLFALDIFGWPFGDPAALLQVLAMGESPAERLLFGAGCSLLLAFLLGRVFCGWLCPYGLLSEGVAALTGSSGAFHASGRKELVCRSGVLTGCVLLVALCGYPALTLTAFPGTLSLAPLVVWLDGFGGTLTELLLPPLLMLLLEFLTGERLWCRFVCPQGFLLGCSARLGRLLVRRQGVPLPVVQWQPECCSCRGETPCRTACTLRVQPRQKGGPDALRCTLCGACVTACAAKGRALRWKLWKSRGIKA